LSSVLDSLLVILMVAIAIGFGTPIGTAIVAKWIVGPVDDAARARSAPARFYMIDALAFITLFQVALVFPTWALREGVEKQLVWPLGLLITGAAVAFWVGAIRALSRAGVHQSLRRAIFVLFVLPAAGAGNFAVAGLAIGCVGNASERKYMWSVVCGVAAVVLIGVLIASRRLTFWVLADRDPPV
jgi:hypothetical protein